MTQGVKIKKKDKVDLAPYILVAPAVIIIAGVVFFPLIKALLMSFQSYDMRRPNNIRFIGLDNYIDVLKDGLFWSSLWHSIVWVVCGVGGQFLFGFILAVLLNKKIKGRGVIRAVSLIPWVTPGVLIGLMWRFMYSGSNGVINDLLQKLHLTSDNLLFLSSTELALPAVIVTIIWQGIPFFALMILAGLQGIPAELYEAADIDGANGFQKLIRITIPGIRNTLLVTLLLRIIWVANSVDIISSMTEGGPAYATQTLSVYIYNKANSLNMGYSSAMAILMCILLCSVAVPYLIMQFRGEDS